MKLALGTVQFGLNYGVFRDCERPSQKQVKQILERAWSYGIELLDTASAYGTSEALLGALNAGQKFKLVSKVSRLPSEGVNTRLITSLVSVSLSRLNLKSAHGIMLHRGADLLRDDSDAIWAGLVESRERGLIERIGVSVYSPEELEGVLARYPITIVQIPYSVFDRRFATSGLLDHLVQSGVEVHARSIFLQGFALSSGSDLPQHLQRYIDQLLAFKLSAEERGMTALEASLGQVKFDDRVAYSVVGVQNLAQIDEICAAWDNACPSPLSYNGSNDIDLIDPSRWDRVGKNR